MQELQKKSEYRKVPSNWAVCQIKQVGQILTGGTPDTSITDYYGREFLWATPIDMGSKKYIEKTTTMLSKKGFGITRHIPKKAILVVCIGSTIGKVGMAYREMSTNQQINSIICAKDDSEFIYYQLLFNQQKIRSTASQVAIPILNKKDFGTIKIYKPNNFEEQQKIVSILSKVDDLIQKTGQVIEQTQRLKKGLMRTLLTNGIGHTKFKKVKSFFGKYEEIPETWNLSKLEDVSLSGLRNGIFKRPGEFGAGVPLVNVSDLFSDGDISIGKLEKVTVTHSELKDFGIQEGDIFFCRSSLVMDGIGHSNIVTNLKEPAVFECHVMMLHPDKKKVSPKFLAYFTQSEMARRYIFCISMTLTMTTIRQPDLECMPILIPPLEEQQKVVSILSATDLIIQNQQNFKSYVEKLKKALMQKLLTGKIRVKL